MTMWWIQTRRYPNIKPFIPTVTQNEIWLKLNVILFQPFFVSNARHNQNFSAIHRMVKKAFCVGDHAQMSLILS